MASGPQEPRAVQSLWPIARRRDLVPADAEQLPKGLNGVDIVVDDEDPTAETARTHGHVLLGELRHGPVVEGRVGVICGHGVQGLRKSCHMFAVLAAAAVTNGSSQMG